jgi:hypothetical protein
VRWNQWTSKVETIWSRSPSRCLGCAKAEADRQTAIRLAREEHASTFYGNPRHAFETVTPVPREWQHAVRQVVRKYAETVNPGGWVEVSTSENYLHLDIWEPVPCPEKWSVENVLYLVRYLSRKPLVFTRARSDSDESPSPHTRTESRKQWDATLPPVLRTDDE